MKDTSIVLNHVKIGLNVRLGIQNKEQKKLELNMILLYRRKVLDRDNWHCKNCGIETPKAKSGTFDDDAPEMDHIVPFVLGGAHVWDNVQCLCRKCNLDKHGKHPLQWISQSMKDIAHDRNRRHHRS